MYSSAFTADFMVHHTIQQILLLLSPDMLTWNQCPCTNLKLQMVLSRVTRHSLRLQPSFLHLQISEAQRPFSFLWEVIPAYRSHVFKQLYLAACSLYLGTQRECAQSMGQDCEQRNPDQLQALPGPTAGGGGVKEWGGSPSSGKSTEIHVQTFKKCF